MHQCPVDGCTRTLPKGCTEACACRAVALDYDGKPVPICSNPRHFKGLQAAETKALNKDRRAEVKEERERLVAHLTAAQAITPKDVALVVHSALEHMPVDMIRAAVHRHAPGTPVQDSSLTNRIPHAVLARTEPDILIRLAVDVLLHYDLQNKYDNEHAQADEYHWYIDNKPARSGVRCAICHVPLAEEEIHADGRCLCAAHWQAEISTSEIAPSAEVPSNE